MSWVTVVGRDRLRIIGVLEVLGAIGVVLPATGVLSWLAPVAAGCLALLMAFAIALHLRRPGEVPNAAFNVVLGALALTVAIGRTVVDPF